MNPFIIKNLIYNDALKKLRKYIDSVSQKYFTNEVYD